MGGLFDNFWTSRVSISTDKRNFGSPRYVFEVHFGRPVAIERKWESSEGNFTRTKAKIGVKIRRIRCFRELWSFCAVSPVSSRFCTYTKDQKQLSINIYLGKPCGGGGITTNCPFFLSFYIFIDDTIRKKLYWLTIHTSQSSIKHRHVHFKHEIAWIFFSNFTEKNFKMMCQTCRPIVSRKENTISRNENQISSMVIKRLSHVWMYILEMSVNGILEYLYHITWNYMLRKSIPSINYLSEETLMFRLEGVSLSFRKFPLNKLSEKRLFMGMPPIPLSILSFNMADQAGIHVDFVKKKRVHRNTGSHWYLPEHT